MTSPPPGDAIVVSEIFSAIQGEGALLGARQLFCRLAGCNIRCSYCDQPEALELSVPTCRIEQTAGRRDFETVANPVPTAELVRAISKLWPMVRHHSLSLTGGEPLFQAPRLGALLTALTELAIPVYLETNATLPHAVARLATHLRYVSADLKLDSADHQAVRAEPQYRFLGEVLSAAAATGTPELFVKIVVGPGTTPGEVRSAAGRVFAMSPATTVYLQPVTPIGTADRAPSPELVLDLQAAALQVHPDVRVVPQTHKLIGQL